MSAEAKTQNAQGNNAGMIGAFIGVVVFFAGKALLPATGPYWSDTGPRNVILMAAAAGAAFVVTLAVSLTKSSKK